MSTSNFLLVFLFLFVSSVVSLVHAWQGEVIKKRGICLSITGVLVNKRNVEVCFLHLCHKQFFMPLRSYLLHVCNANHSLKYFVCINILNIFKRPQYRHCYYPHSANEEMNHRIIFKVAHVLKASNWQSWGMNWDPALGYLGMNFLSFS